MAEKTMLLVVNPTAGQKKVLRFLGDIISLFNREDYKVITHITAAAGDGKQAVLRYAKEIALVVCCGGDGTYNEALSGVLDSGLPIPIGYIPAGSTNDLATSLHLSGNIMKAAQDILAGKQTPLDVGEFNGRYFSYIASFGLFTKASYATPQELKNTLGHAAYILSGIQEISQIKTYRLSLSLDDGQELTDDFIFGSISNSTRFGGVLTLAADMVDLSDGLLEVLLIRAPKDLLELADCVRAMQQQRYDNPMITFQKAKTIKITAPGDMDWTLDGEKQTGTEEITVNCLHKAITIVQN